MQPSPHLSSNPVSTNLVSNNLVRTNTKDSKDSNHRDVEPIATELYQDVVYQTPLRTHVKSAVYQYLKELDGQPPTNLYDTFLQEVEKPLIEVVLEQTHGNQSKACLILGLNRGTLRKKMQLYGLL